MYINRVIATVLLLFAITSYAQELGTFGQTYPIAEQDFLEFIGTRLKKLEANGQLAAMQKKLTEETKKHIDRPKPVAITKATQSRSWLFDPSITVKNSIFANGKIVVKAGTKANPLDLITPKPLIFYNADDKEQVTWARNMDKKLHGKEKLVLVNGSVFSQVKLFQKAVYFDQGGKLTSHFNIKHVPAMVEANNKHFKVTEIKLST